MKILFANRYINELGGIEQYIEDVASRLKEKGHHTGIVHWDESKGAPHFNEAHRISAIWDNELDIDGKTLDRLDEVLKEFSPDIVYLHAVENKKVIDYFAGKARTVRYVHGYKTIDPDGKMLLYNPIEESSYPLSPACFLRAFTRRCMPRSPIKGIKAYMRARGSLEATKRLDDIIVASDRMKRMLVKNGVEEGKITILPYFVSYQPTEDAAFDKNRILFAGRIVEAKGLDMLLEVLSLVKEDFILDVAGTGPAEEACRKKAKDLGLLGKVRFLGWVEHEEVADLYRKCAFLALPSIWPEPFGICGIEAAFFGKPAVAFNVGGISDWLIDGETGFLAEPYRKEEMAEKISNLLNDPEKAREMGKKAKARAVQKYNPDLHLEKLLRIFMK
ncbi:MAG: glycosyltransferase family 4 protein [Candidatus Omnitrophota bacterium]